jgi:Flp pilus assembly protein TadG
VKIQIASDREPITHRNELGSSAASKLYPVGDHPLVLTLSKLFQGESQGQSMVEFALVLPIVLALLTGICAFGVAFNNQLTLNRAVGIGAQNLQLIRTSSTNPCQDTFTAIENAAPNLTPGSITLTLTASGSSVTSNSCAGDQSYLVQGQPVTVTATYPCALFVYGSKALSSCQLSAKVTEYEY